MSENIKRESIFQTIERIADILPLPVYWLDANGLILGANELAFKTFGGANLREKIIGNHDHRFYPKELADVIVENNRKVLEFGKAIEFEEKIVNIDTGTTKYLTSIRSPLRDYEGKIIGIVGASIDITDTKEKERLELENQALIIRTEEREKIRKDISKIFDGIARVAEVVPLPLYWLNEEGVILGANNLAFKMVGGENARERIIGNQDHNFYPKELADTIVENNKKVLELGETIEFEEKIVNIDTGTTQYLTSIRSPLRDYEGKIIGIVGASIDITDTKEKERLEVENQAHQAAAKEQDKFRTIVRQLVHDVNAPISSINNIVSRLNNIIPENERITLRNASERIAGISQKLLSQYEKLDEDSDEIFLASLALMQIINERREDHRETGITIELNIDEEANFSCIKHNSGVFKRMISNLVKNAVEALREKLDGKVTIELGAVNNKIVLLIEDNGYGMP
ncbi:MAG: PAS domain-containing protein [Neisseriaceae bacterium]